MQISQVFIELPQFSRWISLGDCVPSRENTKNPGLSGREDSARWSDADDYTIVALPIRVPLNRAALRLNKLYQAELLLRRAIPRAVFEFRYQRIGVLPFWSTANVSPAELNFGFGNASKELSESVRCQAGAAVYEARRQAGHQFAWAAKGGELLGVCWVAKTQYDDIDTGLTLQLKPDELWLYGAWVRRDWRGKGVYRKLLETLIEGFDNEESNRFLLAVDLSNGVSHATHTKLGTQWIGNCSGIKVFGFGKYHLKMNRGRAQDS